MRPDRAALLQRWRRLVWLEAASNGIAAAVVGVLSVVGYFLFGSFGLYGLAPMLGSAALYFAAGASAPMIVPATLLGMWPRSTALESDHMWSGFRARAGQLLIAAGIHYVFAAFAIVVLELVLYPGDDLLSRFLMATGHGLGGGLVVAIGSFGAMVAVAAIIRHMQRGPILTPTFDRR